MGFFCCIICFRYPQIEEHHKFFVLLKSNQKDNNLEGWYASTSANYMDFYDLPGPLFTVPFSKFNNYQWVFGIMGRFKSKSILNKYDLNLNKFKLDLNKVKLNLNKVKLNLNKFKLNLLK